ncbi:hypothetical protein BBK36DRAFT_335 [Trichoderma citrinoviride]|uniref:Uncharacterized protein n=1 Tax=Trichoderma citrinoviride TaxID=58853 RepID=A0A2T4BMB9_9HYPO|nr:hypothetical protein BBK36DRAFT_335 [Trichoderma citrinoviride]PTB70462.1 hypothetical protein BBK36DRAFT_335 [Trichoderma citrinoviride]
MEYLLGRIRTAPPGEDDRQWEWDWKKYYLQPEILSTDLHNRFNSHTLSIRHPEDFHREVQSCIELAETEEDFMARLEERKAQRVQEVVRAWRSICAVIESNSGLLAIPELGDEQTTDKENVDEETIDHQNADKDEGHKGGDDNHHDEGDDENATSPSSSTFYLDDISTIIEEGRRRWAEETCAGVLQKRRMQRLAASAASARTTAELTAPDSLFCAGIWYPDGLLPSVNLPRKQSTSQDEVQPIEAAPLANTPPDEPQEQPQVHHQQAFSEQCPGAAETGFTAPTETDISRGEGFGLVVSTEPLSERHRIDSVVSEASSPASTREPMELDSGEEDGDVIMTDAASTEPATTPHPRPRKSRTAPHGSHRQDKHVARDGKLLRGKRSTPLQQQQNRVKKKQSRRHPSKGTKSPALLDRLLRSSRSSRRDPGHELWYLNDDATACPVTKAE